VFLAGCTNPGSENLDHLGEGGLEWGCRDVTDNDGNGLVDCEDPACVQHEDCFVAMTLDSGRQEDDSGDDTALDAEASMGVEIRPEHPLPSDDLECVITAPALGPKAMGIVYHLVWTRSGLLLSQEPVLSADQTSHGDILFCEVTASDAEGEVVASAIVEVEVKLNHPPSKPGVTFEQIGTSDLVCYVAEPSVDPEEDSVRYRYAWKVDGVDDPEHTCSVLSLTGYTSGRTFTCTVTPSDAYGDGDPGSALHVVESSQ
jgi:hypothetical protein